MKYYITCICAAACCLGSAAGAAEGEDTRVVRLVQDDAQDYMVSKIYVLKYVQSNDIAPFVMGMIKRYNMNSMVNCIEYGNNNEQILTVTCPRKMMPYVDEFLKMVDRPIEIAGKVPGDIIKGTGITREVYRPKYRSGQDLINVVVNAAINNGPYDSVYGWDKNSNQIYWKDNSSNSQFMFQFLGWLDRPAPQVNFVFTVVEVRESEMLDLGVDYLAWKNGPGLNLFSGGFQVFSVNSAGSAAIQSASGPFGAFLFAPQFDASFLRVLAQSGKAKVTSTATMSVANSDSESYSLMFNPQLQNIVKSNNDQTSVAKSQISLQPGMSQIYLKLVTPIVNLHYGIPSQGFPANEPFSFNDYSPGEYAKFKGTVNFGYSVQTANVVERNNVGTELIETSEINGTTLIELNNEVILAKWDKFQDVEQTVGMPFLSKIPVLKYFFGTTTRSKEKTSVYMTVKATLLNTAAPNGIETGKLFQVKR